jgi:uncharacterized protein
MHPEDLWLALAALVGGALNAVAGGGSFLTFPALVLTGVPAVSANATSAVALWPGSVASAYAYRGDLAESRRFLSLLATASVVGGLVGAGLLLFTSNATFVRILPFLLLVATLVFTFGARLNERLLGAHARVSVTAGAVIQLGISVYGGYFGGGMGIVMLAAFAAMGMTHIHAMNALKTFLATLINLVAIVVFIAAGAVAWRPGIVMILSGTVGGYVGATVARRVDAARVRSFVLVVAWTMTAYFFWKASR